MTDSSPVILIDAGIPWATSVLDGIGKRVFFDPATGKPDTATLSIADVLVVSSSVRINSEILAPCESLRAIATPVVGTDHVDMGAVRDLASRLGHGISVFNAPGSTAGAVADWTIGAMITALGRLPASVGIVGFGNCGHEVARRLNMLGIPWLACDPLLAPPSGHTPLSELAEAEVVTFHVPLTTPSQSPFPTVGMVSRELCVSYAAASCRLVINCSRGGILSESMFAGSARGLPAFALDVFMGEPAPSPLTVAAATVATPHVAGSGRLGRARAINMVSESVIRALGLSMPPGGLLPPDSIAASELIRSPVNTLTVNPATAHTDSGFAALRDALVPLSGVALSAPFKAAWATCDERQRATVFRLFRLEALRTEPTWLAG